jgi:hypothetical protein
VKYFVDGALVATHNVAIAGQMRPIVSDNAVDANHVTVDSLALMAFPTSGTFTSRVLDAGDATANWDTLTSSVSLPTNTTVEFDTRSGQTPADVSAAGWTPVPAGGAISGGAGRYLQYRARLTTLAGGPTPAVDRVAISYTDNAGPDATASDPQVSGTSASIAFSSTAPDLAGFQCSLDGGAPATCTSPYAVNGLAPGAHTVTVHGVDKLGNAGPNVAKTFTIASPATSGGGGATGTTQQSGTGSSTATDKTKPKVSVVAKSLKASKKGAVSFTVGCPATEQSCKITVRLKNGKKTAASKTVNVKGGKSKTVTLTLDPATRKLLAKRHTLKVSTVVIAVDAAGNKRTTTKQATLRRAAA